MPIFVAYTVVRSGQFMLSNVSDSVLRDAARGPTRDAETDRVARRDSASHEETRTLHAACHGLQHANCNWALSQLSK